MGRDKKDKSPWVMVEGKSGCKHKKLMKFDDHNGKKNLTEIDTGLLLKQFILFAPNQQPLMNSAIACLEKKQLKSKLLAGN